MNPIQELERQLDSAPGGRCRIEALNHLAWGLRQTDLARSLSLAEEAETLCGPDLKGSLAQELVKSLRTQAFANTVRGDYRKALAITDRVLEATLDLDMPECRVDMLNSLGWCVGVSGDHARAITLLLEALDLATEIGSEIRQARVLTSLGAIYSFAQDRERAVESLERALAMHDLHSSLPDKAITLNNLALAYLDLDRDEEAYNAARESLALCTSDNDAHLESVLDTLGDICLKRGELDEAERYLRQAVDTARRSKGRADVCTALFHLSQVHFGQDRLAQARETASEALALAHEIDVSYEHYRLHETLAEILEAENKAGEALCHYRLFHKAKEGLFSQEAAEKLRNLQTAYELEAARKDAEIHQLRNVELEQEIVERRKAESELEEAVAQLQTALDEVRNLSGLVPICASCKKIRSDEGYWEHVEEYITSHTNAQFSHGLCPDCARKLYGELGERALEEDDDEPSTS